MSAEKTYAYARERQWQLVWTRGIDTATDPRNASQWFLDVDGLRVAVKDAAQPTVPSDPYDSMPPGVVDPRKFRQGAQFGVVVSPKLGVLETDFNVAGAGELLTSLKLPETVMIGTQRYEIFSKDPIPNLAWRLFSGGVNAEVKLGPGNRLLAPGSVVPMPPCVANRWVRIVWAQVPYTRESSYAADLGQQLAPLPSSLIPQPSLVQAAVAVLKRSKKDAAP